MSDMLTAIANMLDEVGIHCNIQQVDSATNNQYMKDGTWEGLMLHFATIAPDLETCTWVVIWTRTALTTPRASSIPTNGAAGEIRCADPE